MSTPPYAGVVYNDPSGSHQVFTKHGTFIKDVPRYDVNPDFVSELGPGFVALADTSAPAVRPEAVSGAKAKATPPDSERDAEAAAKSKKADAPTLSSADVSPPAPVVSAAPTAA